MTVASPTGLVHTCHREGAEVGGRNVEPARHSLRAHSPQSSSGRRASPGLNGDSMVPAAPAGSPETHVPCPVTRRLVRDGGGGRTKYPVRPTRRWPSGDKLLLPHEGRQSPGSFLNKSLSEYFSLLEFSALSVPQFQGKKTDTDTTSLK